jgi:hypothetical protein
MRPGHHGCATPKVQQPPPQGRAHSAAVRHPSAYLVTRHAAQTSITPLLKIVSHAGELEHVVSSSGAGRRSFEKPVPPSLSVRQLLEAKNARPVLSLDELAADTFSSDQELEDFLAFTYAERHRFSA